MADASNELTLAEIRARIDELDLQLQGLFNERAELALQVARAKQAAGRTDFYRPEREAQVLERLASCNTGPMSDQALQSIMREIMSACLALQKPLQAAYLGPEGTFTHVAAQKHFGQSVSLQPEDSIDAIFKAVESDQVHYGVVPVENSTAGMVAYTLDCLVNSSLFICGEMALPIHHQLLSKAPDLETIQKVLAHPQALSQCRHWLDTHLADRPREAVSSNGEAARLAVSDSALAAIAPHAASQRYQLSLLACNIEDVANNTTRFWILGKQQVAASGRDMTSIMVAIRNSPGMLHRLVAPAAELGVDLVRIESRPSLRQAWDYNFFIDLKGHIDDSRISQLLAAIRREAVMLKVLDSYTASTADSAN